MLQEETSYFDLEDIEKMRQVALGDSQTKVMSFGKN